jgi:hypothetical protein
MIVSKTCGLQDNSRRHPEYYGVGAEPASTPFGSNELVAKKFNGILTIANKTMSEDSQFMEGSLLRGCLVDIKGYTRLFESVSKWHTDTGSRREHTPVKRGFDVVQSQ